MKKICLIYCASLLTLLSSCLLTYRATEIQYMTSANGDHKKETYQYNTYFLFKFHRPFYKNTRDELELSSFLVLVNDSLKITKNNILPYLIKNGDTTYLQVIKPFETFSYPGIANEPELYIHFDYAVLHKASNITQQVKEDIKLYRHLYHFRSVH